MLPFVALSARNGAMKRGFGSHGLVAACVYGKHDGVISIHAVFEPSDLPPFVVTAISRSTYSTTARSPLFGSTSVSPPSPPNGDTMFVVPVVPAGAMSDSPLSCRPPQMASPPVTLPAPA